MTDWKQIASKYKRQHEKDTSAMARMVAQLIKFRGNGCTCHNRPGDEYYCSVHGGEGCLIDLKVKADMLVEKLGDWIVNQSDDVKQSAADAFGDELKLLGQTLQNMTDDTIRAAGLDPDEVGQRMEVAANEALRRVAGQAEGEG